MRASIFDLLKEYESDPITEYKKISRYSYSTDCTYNDSIFMFFEKNFYKFELLSNHFANYEECLQSFIYRLNIYKDFNFESLKEEQKNEILEEFLLFCDTQIYMTLKVKEKLKDDVNLEIINHYENMIKVSLGSLYYGVIYDNSDEGFKIIKSYPEAEIVAVNSDDEIKKIIYDFLDYENQNVERKEAILLKFVNKLETILKSDKEPYVHSIREFVQIIRHSEEKKKSEYWWFFDKDYSSNLDKLFVLCLYVQERTIVKKILDEFTKNKSIKN